MEVEKKQFFITNIYLCCSQKNYNLFKKLLLKIFNGRKDIRIFHYNVDELSADEHKLSLCEMNYAVIVVDNEFFDNDFLVQETKVVINNNVHIIPITINEISEKKYKSLFGNRQYIFWNTSVENESSFNSLKLLFSKEILSSEEINEIILSFESTIFLSYRRKDRQIAKKLINLIHLNNSYLDSAIWYDGYLTPGENFNDEIKNKIKECNIFSLVITPNLVIEDNYVKNIEYPMAIKLNKRILSVECEKTSLSTLNEQYPGVLLTIVKNDFESILQALNSTIKNSNLKSFTTQKKYYLGLAYINGIYVERNVRIGINLLESAAQESHIEACLELSKIYESSIEFYDFEKSQNYYKNYWILRAKKFSMQNDFESILLDYCNIIKLFHVDRYKIAFDYLTVCKKNCSLTEVNILFMLADCTQNGHTKNKINDIKKEINSFKKNFLNDKITKSFVDMINMIVSFFDIKLSNNFLKNSRKLVNNFINNFDNYCSLLGIDNTMYLIYVAVKDYYCSGKIFYNPSCKRVKDDLIKKAYNICNNIICENSLFYRKELQEIYDCVKSYKENPFCISLNNRNKNFISLQFFRMYIKISSMNPKKLRKGIIKVDKRIFELECIYSKGEEYFYSIHSRQNDFKLAYYALIKDYDSIIEQLSNFINITKIALENKNENDYIPSNYDLAELYCKLARIKYMKNPCDKEIETCLNKALEYYKKYNITSTISKILKTNYLLYEYTKDDSKLIDLKKTYDIIKKDFPNELNGDEEEEVLCLFKDKNI